MGATPLFTIQQYFKYLLRAVGPHSLHSPFVFDLFNQVIKPSSKFRIKKIEDQRKLLKTNHQLIDVTDFKNNRTKRKTVSSLAKTSLSRAKFSAFLHLLANYLDTTTILETGTSLGINSMYLASKQSSVITTVEGSPILQQLAADSFKKLQFTNITIASGEVNQLLPSVLERSNPELIFLDADHRGKALSQQIDSIMAMKVPPKCIVAHDIYWSKDMALAWDQLIRDGRFSLTLDVFQAGLLFPNRNIEKQHFTLRF